MEPTPQSAESNQVVIPVEAGELEGTLVIPRGALGVVLFAHGSGSSRHSPRNQSVARYLERARVGTLLLDLLTRGEGRIDEQTAYLRFDIGLLARRLAIATDWLATRPQGRGLRLGYFGASTGAAAALVAAVERASLIAAVVSRGGRPDLAGGALERVAAPTLLIVGGDDTPVIELNESALGRLRCDKHLEIVRGAGHLFEESGTLERVADLAVHWFAQHFVHPPTMH